MDRYDYETLKDCLSHTYNKYDLLNLNVWYGSDETVLSVARILNSEYRFSGRDTFNSVDNCIDYFESPWKWETDVRELVVEWELEQVGKDFDRLTTEEAELALSWLSEWGYENKTAETLEETLEERIECSTEVVYC